MLLSRLTDRTCLNTNDDADTRQKDKTLVAKKMLAKDGG